MFLIMLNTMRKKTGNIPNKNILSTILIKFSDSPLINFSSFPYPKLKKISPKKDLIKKSVRKENKFNNLNILYHTLFSLFKT